MDVEEVGYQESNSVVAHTVLISMLRLTGIALGC